MCVCVCVCVCVCGVCVSEVNRTAIIQLYCIKINGSLKLPYCLIVKVEVTRGKNEGVDDFSSGIDYFLYEIIQGLCISKVVV